MSGWHEQYAHEGKCDDCLRWTRVGTFIVYGELRFGTPMGAAYAKNALCQKCVEVREAFAAELAACRHAT